MDTPDLPENKLPFDDEGESHRNAHESLANFVFTVLVLVIVISGTFNIRLIRLCKNSREDTRNLRAQYQALKAQYQAGEGPMIERATKALSDFGATNPDYVPLLTKYGLKPSATAATPPPAAPKK